MTGPGPDALAGIDLRRHDLRRGGPGPDALARIGESEAELAAICPPEERYGFSPVLTACRDGRVVGCGGMAPCDGHGELKRVFLTRAARGRWLEAAIVGALEDEPRARGLPVMRLETGRASPEAIRAYRRLGYVRRGAFGYAGNGLPVFMEKLLVTRSASGSPAPRRPAAGGGLAHPPARRRTADAGHGPGLVSGSRVRAAGAAGMHRGCRGRAGEGRSRASADP